ncbi:MAG: hypothetical protein WCB79_09375 [Halobacteriota archaeon]
MQTTYPQTDTGDKKQPIYKLFAAYLHTVPLEELLASVERARRDAQLRILIWSWSDNDEIYNSKHDKEYPVRCYEG